MSISRAELYGFDSKGRPIKSMRNSDVKCRGCRVAQRDCPSGNGDRCCDECWHPQVMRAKAGSSPAILEHATPAELLDEQIENEICAVKSRRKANMAKAVATLTHEERVILALKAEPVSQKATREIPIEELVDALEKGWQLDAQANGVAIVSSEVFVRPSYEEIGRQLGLTARQVHRRIAAANKKLRSAMR